MATRFFKSVSLLLFLSVGTDVVAIQAVHDSVSFAKMVEVLKVGSQQLKQVQGLRREMSELSSLLGDTKIGSFLADKGLDLMALEDLGGSLDAIGDGDLWSLNEAAQKYGGSKDYSQFIRAKEYAGRKLHGLEERASRESVLKPTAIKTQADLEEVVSNRQHYAMEASSTGQAMAHEQKHTWSKKRTKALKSLSEEVDHQTSLMGMMALNNKLLELIAAELQTQSMIMAQVLDNVSALTAQTAPIAFRGKGSSSGLADKKKDAGTLQPVKASAKKVQNLWGY